MNLDQLLLAGLLAAMLALFVWGRFRHDVVAMAALLAAVALDIVPVNAAFSGFAHPAVITVAAVLVLSHALEASGAVDVLVRKVLPTGAGAYTSIGMITGLGALLSGVMNNVGALALLMPVALQVAARLSIPPGRVLMPLAFGTILGGMTTLVGTPPNLIVSGFRADVGLGAFSMFDFTPVGVVVSLLGVLVVTLGWKLVPRREGSDTGFVLEGYLTELRVEKGSELVGRRLAEADEVLEAYDAQIVGYVHKDVRLIAPHPSRVLAVGDVLVVEARAAPIKKMIGALGLALEEAVDPSSSRTAGESSERGAKAAEASGQVDAVLAEVVVLPRSALVGRTPTQLQLRTRYAINLLALSRQGSLRTSRLRSTLLRAGDVLLLQGTAETIASFASEMGCLPLAPRALHVPSRSKAVLASMILGLAVSAASFGVPAALAFTAAVVVSVVTRTVALRQLYQVIDGSIVVLLAALIPVAGAMESTGTASLVAHAVLEYLARGDAMLALVAILVVTSALSALVNNAATAAVMLPVAFDAARELGVSPDAFLMAVAVGSSCAFVTPVAHQNNTLILGPGGFRFGDYWRLGLVVQLVVIAVAVPMLMWVWPL
jgi:di/tricarboxylate transporter